MNETGTDDTGTNDTARMLVEMSERLFGAACEKSVLIAAETGEWPAALWAQMADAGLPHALVPDDKGGSGLSIPDALAALRVSARHSAPVPFAETLLASWLLGGAGLAAPEGPLTIAPVVAGERLHLTRNGAGWQLKGRATRIPFARHATSVAVVADADGATMVASVEVARATQTPGANIAREPRDTLDFDCALPADAVAPVAKGLTSLDVRAFGAALRTVQIAGALSQALDLTVRYAQERVQFGKPIGKFQAVQHSIAMLAAHAAAAGAAADMAAEAAGYEMDPLVIGAAKTRAGEAASLGAALAHQMHGAIGFTHEHLLHFSTKRLWSWRDEFGKESEWSLLLGRAALAAGSRKLWSDLVTA
jgi:acyl-CoA dehydrogenase